MKKLLVLLLSSCALVSAQAVRVDPSPITTTAPSVGHTVGNAPLLAITNSTVTLCNYPAVGIPCTNLATTYTDLSATVSCPAGQQIVLAGSASCSAKPDTQGNFGYWLIAGAYAYTVTYGNNSYGPYPITAGLASGSVITGPFTADQLAGIYQVDRYNTGGTGSGANGYARTFQQCTGVIACLMAAPTYYTLSDLTPWGGANWSNTGFQTQSYPFGPKGADPIAGIIDYRYGVPQQVFNSSIAVDNRHNASPTFAMNALTVGQGRFSHYANALTLINSAFTGGRNSDEVYGDKVNQTTLESYLYKYTQVQSQGNIATFSRCFGNGDCVGHMHDQITYGNANTEADEGAEGQREETVEGGEVTSGTINGFTIAGDGTTQFTLSSVAYGGFQGEGRLVIDLTRLYNTGYIGTITNVGGLTKFNGIGTNWDATFNVSSVTTSTAAIADPGNEGNLNVFPLFNVSIPVVSSSGFNTSQVGCIFDYDHECFKVTSVPDSTHVVAARIQYPHRSGATVSTGGLAGYGVEMEADRVDPANLNGITTSPDSHLVSLVRTVWPVMYNTAGESLTLFQPSGIPAGNWGGYNGRAMTATGTGGTATATISAGAVTAIVCSGGSGYSGQHPPALTFSGSWTTPPSGHVTNTSGGGVSICVVDNPGTGVTSATISVDPKNQYDIYPSAKTLSVYNATTGTVDGSFTTQAWAGNVSNTDVIEQPHYFWNHNRGSKNVVAQYVPSFKSSAGAGFDIELRGIHGNSDAALKVQNFSPNCLYMGYPNCNNSIPGFGQLASPPGFQLLGPFRSGLFLNEPPQGSPGGFQAGAVVVRCGAAGGCPAGAYPALSLFNGVGEDVISYNPSTQCWLQTSGSTSNSGGSSVYQLSYCGGVLSLAGATANFSAATITATTQAHLADSLLNAGFSSQTLGYNFSNTPSSTFDFGIKYAVPGGLGIAAYNASFASNSIGFFLTHPTTFGLTDFQVVNGRGIALRSDWKFIFCSTTDAGGLNANCTPGAVTAYTGTPGNISVGSGLGLQDGTVHLATVQSGATGPTLTWGASAPTGSCVTGSLFSLNSGAGGLYVCQSSAWVLK